MLQVDADYVVIDNSWLWRADHIQSGQLVQGQNPCQAGRPTCQGAKTDSEPPKKIKDVRVLVIFYAIILYMLSL